VLVYVGTASTQARFVRMERGEHGWHFADPSDAIPSLDGNALLFAYRGPNFFAEVPTLLEELPDPREAGRPGVIVLDVGELNRFSSTLLKGLATYSKKLSLHGHVLVLVGIDPEARELLDATGVSVELGEANLLGERDYLGGNLDLGWEHAEALLGS
jgi:anti-anti-sigma regulatory factor